MALCTTNVVGIRIRVMDMAFLDQIRHYKLYFFVQLQSLPLALTKYSPSHTTTISFTGF